jgi:hypothetical protein
LSNPDKTFRLDAKKNIVGPSGIYIDTNGTGLVVLDVDRLNQLLHLLATTRPVYTEPTMSLKERMANAKEDLAMDLGLDPDDFK